VRFVRRELGIRPGIEVEDEAAVWHELDFVAELLADGRPHLCGERFGAADLTFAALSAALVVPPLYDVPLPQPEALPPDTAALVARVREHPAGPLRAGAVCSTAAGARRLIQAPDPAPFVLARCETRMGVGENASRVDS
jgi:glutathione S-transferase